MATITRKSLSAVAVASLLAAGTFFGAGAVNGGATFLPSAAAQTTQTAAIDGIPETASLQINKRLDLPGETRDNGTEITSDVPGDPAEGIEFSIFPVTGIDLTTLAGWKAADDLDINTFFTGGGPNSYSSLITEGLGAEQTATTDAGGVAPFNDIDTGLYLVVEEANPTLTNGQAVAPAAPFLVTVPMTDPVDRTTWLDTVHVYPKNQAVAAPAKTIGDPVPTDVGAEGPNLTGSSLGELISYNIQGQVPDLSQETALNGFTITDKLPAELGEPQELTVSLNGTPLEADAFTSRTWPVTEDGAERQVLSVVLSADTLSGVAAEATIDVGFKAEVTAVPQATLDNQAWVSPTAIAAADGWNPGVDGPNPGTVSNATRSIYGEINIQKTGQGDDLTGLANAIFELHRCDADGNLAAGSLPIQVGGTTTWTTADDGGASISGIHLANVTDQDDLAGTYDDLWAGNGEQFCLVETEAPEGYALLPEPVGVTLPYGADTVNLVSVDQPIENVENNAGFSLPLTGGMGIWLILGGGILLLLIAAAYYLVTRKRDNA